LRNPLIGGKVLNGNSDSGAGQKGGKNNCKRKVDTDGAFW
jgi:hypothetical protein